MPNGDITPSSDGGEPAAELPILLLRRTLELSQLLNQRRELLEVKQRLLAIGLILLLAIHYPALRSRQL